MHTQNDSKCNITEQWSEIPVHRAISPSHIKLRKCFKLWKYSNPDLWSLKGKSLDVVLQVNKVIKKSPVISCTVKRA